MNRFPRGAGYELPVKCGFSSVAARSPLFFVADRHGTCMKRPSFQFYPADWRGNAKLRRCSHAERGIWIEVLCLMHDGEEYGVLRWPLKDIAQAVNCRLQDLRGMIEKGVLKGDDTRIEPYIYIPRHAGKDGTPIVLLPAQSGPIWYSSRMVRDEYVRTIRGVGTRFGDQPKSTPTRREGAGASGFGLQSSASSTPPGSSTTSSTATRPPVNNSRKPDGEKAHGKNGNHVTRWWDTNEGIEAKGRELGVKALPGEMHGTYKSRLFNEIARRERSKTEGISSQNSFNDLTHKAEA